MDEDREAIAQVLDGVTGAFRFLVEKYQRVVWTFAWNMLRNHADADDLAQDVFVAAYHNLTTFDGKRARFVTWLLAIARNRCCNALKGRPPAIDSDHEPAGRESSPDSNLLDAEIWEQLDAALQNLPIDQRSAFVLAEIQKLPYSEIAAIEGVELGTVKSRISRAKQRLRDLLRPAMIGDSPTIRIHP